MFRVRAARAAAGRECEESKPRVASNHFTTACAVLEVNGW